MDLQIIPFRTVNTALIRAQDEGTETKLFNTRHHPHDKIAAIVPETATFKHVHPDERVQHLNNWLELIMQTQGETEWDTSTFRLTPLLMQGLVDAYTVYNARGKPNLDRTAELLELFPRKTPAGVLTRNIFEGYTPSDVEQLLGPDGLAGHVPQEYVELFADKHIPPLLPYFLRLDACSTKDGFRRGAPVHTLEDVIIDLSTSLRAAGALSSILDPSSTFPQSSAQVSAATPAPEPQQRQDQPQTANLCLLPFNRHMSTDHEFRVFCPPDPSRVVAISQYKWHAPFFTNDRNRAQEICNTVYEGALTIHQDIMAFVQKDGREFIREKIHSEGFVMDVLFVEGEVESETETESGGEGKEGAGEEDGRRGDHVQLVEINPFGAMSGCGSALFQWIVDARVLYGVNEGVQFRITMD